MRAGVRRIPVGYRKFWSTSCMCDWRPGRVATVERGGNAGDSKLMTLDDAFARVAQTHPELRLVDARATVLAAERDQAVQRPPWTLGAEVENALGTGAARGLDSELTLSLSSVLERGGKLDARRTLAQSRIDALAVQRETGRLDLLAETAQRYLAVVGADRQRSLANMDVGQRQRTVAAARQRLQAGASPESVVLTAQAALREQS
jgi:cobalt-zinc-cadmium efflux system outer membrane protein